MTPSRRARCVASAAAAVWALAGEIRVCQAQTGAEAAWLDSIGFNVRAQVATYRTTRAGMRAANLTSLSAALRSSTLVDVESAPSGRTRIVIREAGAPECLPDLYVNGVLLRVDDEIARSGLDRLLPARSVTAVEVLHEVRGRFWEPGACGVVLVWSADWRARADGRFAGNVRGRIIDDACSCGIAGVIIDLLPGDRAATSTRSGEFHFPAVPAGPYRLRVRLPGGEEMVRPVDVVADTSLEFEIGVSDVGASALPAGDRHEFLEHASRGRQELVITPYGCGPRFSGAGPRCSGWGGHPEPAVCGPAPARADLRGLAGAARRGD